MRKRYTSSNRVVLSYALSSSTSESFGLTTVSEEMQETATQMAVTALEKYAVEKDVAMYIKKEFDRLYNTTWHCVVGKQYVSLVFLAFCRC